MTYYKFLTLDDRAPYADVPMNTDGTWLPGITNLELCERGYHITDAASLREWFRIGNLYEVEVRGNELQASTKSVHAEMRFVHKVGTVTVEIAVQLAIWSAEQVLHIFEEQFSNDNRPRKAIEAAKSGYKNAAADAADAAYAAADAAYAASDAASYAARYAASAASDAASSAARSAAYAASDAASDAASYAARSAACSASSAASDAARSASYAARSAASFNEQWSAKLFELLEGAE